MILLCGYENKTPAAWGFGLAVDDKHGILFLLLEFSFESKLKFVIFIIALTGGRIRGKSKTATREAL